MRSGPITCVLLVLAIAGTGCTRSFHGEWLEDRQAMALEYPVAEKALPRMALQFDAVSTVRSGWFNDDAGKVDNESVQSNQYFVYDGWRVAQFGAMIARAHGDRLTVTVGKGFERQFIRVHGPSIFPPHVQLPPLSAEARPLPDRYADFGPKLAFWNNVGLGG